MYIFKRLSTDIFLFDSFIQIFLYSFLHSSQNFFLFFLEYKYCTCHTFLHLFYVVNFYFFFTVYCIQVMQFNRKYYIVMNLYYNKITLRHLAHVCRTWIVNYLPLSKKILMSLRIFSLVWFVPFLAYKFWKNRNGFYVLSAFV